MSRIKESSPSKVFLDFLGDFALMFLSRGAFTNLV